MNQQEKQTEITDGHRQQQGGYQKEAGGRLVKGKRDQIMVTKDLTLGGGHTMQYTDDVSQKCTLEICMILLTNITSIHLIF